MEIYKHSAGRALDTHTHTHTHTLTLRNSKQLLLLMERDVCVCVCMLSVCMNQNVSWALRPILEQVVVWRVRVKGGCMLKRSKHPPHPWV